MYLPPHSGLTIRRVLPLLMAAMLHLCSQAGEVLLDAESDGDCGNWSAIKRSTGDQQHPSVITGNGSATVRVPEIPKRDASARVEFRRAILPVTDWRKFERLGMDIFNAGGTTTMLRIEVNTSGNEAQHFVALPPRRWVRAEIDIARFDVELANFSQVKDVQIAIYRQGEPLDVYLDNMVLLLPGERMPALSERFRRDMIHSLADEAAGIERDFSKFRASLRGKRSRQVADWSASQPLKSLGAVRRSLAAQDLTTEQLSKLGDQMDSVARSLSRVRSIVDFDGSCQKMAKWPLPDVLVGTASAMVKLMPREMPLSLAPANDIVLSAARRETESVQIAVLPLRHPLTGVALQVGELRSDAGEVLAHDRVSCDVVGYVETKEQPPENPSYVGWWPDPILSSPRSVDVAPGDLQSFWLRVRVPENQPPGVYRGEVSLQVNGRSFFRIPITLRVRSFTLPAFSPLPSAISFGPPVRPWSAPLTHLVASPAWDRGLKFRWADFLADYYISYDHLYRHGGPDFEILDQLKKQGRLGAFNLGNCDVPLSASGKDADPVRLGEMLGRLNSAYLQAKKRDLLAHAYVYGFDEVKEEFFVAVEQTAAAVRREMPGVLIMTTARDYDFDAGGRMPSIDAWCPTTKHYNPEKASQARARGDQVWWYVCIEPRYPYANIFIQNPAIEARLLMGAMTAKYRPDGFLYYQTSLWQAKEPIKTGPFTNWDPRSYRTAHGDGSWVCMDSEGLPVPTIRLENYRDGLEDFAYFRILEEAVRIKQKDGTLLSEKDKAWLTSAQAALKVPKEILSSLVEFSRNPAEVEEWREQLASLIEDSGIPEINPWKDGFSLRAEDRTKQ